MTATSTPTRPRTPSVSELQAALVAARRESGGCPAAGALASPRSGVPAIGRTATSLADGPSLWLLGTHGGSGARCLCAVLPHARPAGRRWPLPPTTMPPGAAARSGPEPVVLVCRSSHRGLTSAQDYARAYRDGELADQLHLVGVIVSADAPGRPPTPLRRLERLLSGAVPIIARVPWQPAWRLGPPRPDTDPNGAVELPPWVRALRRALADVLSASIEADDPAAVGVPG